jgi:hypothetical protein
MSDIIRFKRSSVAGKVPLAADLTDGELALNTADKKIFGKDAQGNVVEYGGGGAGLTPEKEAELKSRYYHTGTQPIESIAGLVAQLAAKADINTVYAAPIQSAYTVRERGMAAGESVVYPLANPQVSFGFLAFAMRRIDNPPPLVLAPDALGIGSGRFEYNPGLYFGAQIRTNSGALSYAYHTNSNTENNQLIAASSVYTAGYQPYLAFKAGAPASNADCWASLGRPTVANPQWISIKFNNRKTVASYQFQNRVSTNNPPGDWTFQGRNGGGEWVDLHSVSGYSDYGANVMSPLYEIAEPDAYDEYRMHITTTPGTAAYCIIARLRMFSPTGKMLVIGADDQAYVANNGTLTPTAYPADAAALDAVGTTESGQLAQAQIDAIKPYKVLTSGRVSLEIETAPTLQYQSQFDVLVDWAEEYVKFTAQTAGYYKFCYQEPEA